MLCPCRDAVLVSPGRYLDREELTREFEACLVTEQ